MLGFCSLVRTVWFGKKGLRGVEDNTSDIIVFASNRNGFSYYDSTLVGV